MKAFFLFLTLTSVSFFGFSQPDPSVLSIVDEEASFPGGVKEMMLFMSKNLRHPEVGGFSMQGKVYLRFIVEKDGTLTNIEVMRGIVGCPECDKEAVRVVELMPKWNPAKYNGKIVRSYFNIPIVFKLQ